jgi:hypothetical protein
MSRKSTLEAKLLALAPPDESYLPVKLDPRRCGDSAELEDMVSLIVGVGDADDNCHEGLELLLTVDQVVQLQQEARERGLSLAKWLNWRAFDRVPGVE